MDILMPALSPTMEEGTLAKWLVKEGDKVKAGQIIAEIETDKATMEFEAVDEGTVEKLLVAEGTQGVKVNAPIARLSGEDSSVIGHGEVPLVAPVAAKSAPAQVDQPSRAPSSRPRGNDDARLFASPLARRLATERGVDLAKVNGSGPHGRIVRADIDAAGPAERTIHAGEPTTAPSDQAVDIPAPAPSSRKAGPGAQTIMEVYEGRGFDEVRLDSMRRIIAERLSEAKQTIPHFYLRRDARIDSLLDLRQKLNASLSPRGAKLSVNDFIIKAVALALQQVPDANAVWAGDRILRLKPSDVAVAVAVDGGLFTPVLQDAHLKSLSVLSAEMKVLAQRARDRRLSPAEYQGGSIAISNLGMYGIDSFAAVINPPHGGILAVGAGTRKPVVEGDEVRIATVMSLTLSVDHRVIDGVLGADLLKAIAEYLEEPLAMLA